MAKKATRPKSNRTKVAAPNPPVEDGNGEKPAGALFDKRLDSKVHRQLDRLAHQLREANLDFNQASERVKHLKRSIAEICEREGIDGQYRVGDLYVIGKHTPDKWTAIVQPASDED